MKVVYGKRSQRAFNSLDLRHQRILLYIKNVLEIDHSVLEGHRDEETQNRYYGSSPQITTLKWPHSEHNSVPSKAVDVVPYVLVDGEVGGIHWHSKNRRVREAYHQEMVRFATIYQMVGLLLFNTKIRCGCDWDMDWSLMDNDFMDLPHQELIDEESF